MMTDRDHEWARHDRRIMWMFRAIYLMLGVTAVLKFGIWALHLGGP